MSETRVLKAETVWHYDISQGEKGSDKVYSVQLINDKTGSFSVESQYGRRGGNLKSAPTSYSGVSEYVAEQVYNNLLRTKVQGKKGDAYDRTISPAIVPTEFGGAGYSRSISKADELKNSKDVNSLHDFLSTSSPATNIVEDDADFSALIAAFRD